MKYLCNRIGWFCRRRAPQGARGLKCKGLVAMVDFVAVAPRKGRVG